MARSKRASFLLEVRSEEIPARMLVPAMEELEASVTKGLIARNLEARVVETGFTPRRLVLVLKGLPTVEPDAEEVSTGPPAQVAFDADGKPTAAAVGFARRFGVEAVDLERLTTSKGEYVAVRQISSGRPTVDLLAEIVPRALESISWAKTMRWGRREGPWVRPVHGVLALFDGAVVPFRLFGIETTSSTCGHPILSPATFSVRGPGDYRRKLADRGVQVDFQQRREAIRAAMSERAAASGGKVVADDELLAKVAAICEIPGVMEGQFDPAYLGLPREVLVASLRDHQSAFTVEDGGELLPRFLTVMDRPDDPAGRVRAGNEWVVAARLADARFFYDEDHKIGLTERSRQLGSLTFHERLGSYAAKGERLVSLIEHICGELGWKEEGSMGAETARLLKADLATEMVREFTSLQGVMGGIYAREEGHPEAIWQAIYDHYRPASVEASLPKGRLGLACALADRIDTLVGVFGLGIVPTGSRDPFGLRRAAQGVLRILLEGELSLDFELVAAHAARLYGDALELGTEELLGALRPFMADRTRYLLGREGFAYDEIEAGLAAGASNLPDLRSRVAALHEIRDQPDFLSIVLAAKRIANIVKDAPELEPDDEIEREAAEAALYEALAALKEEVEDAVEERAYGRALRAIASLAEILDRFFVEVLVMAEDPRIRENRIALLQEIQRTLSRTAILTEIVVDKAEYR